MSRVFSVHRSCVCRFQGSRVFSVHRSCVCRVQGSRVCRVYMLRIYRVHISRCSHVYNVPYLPRIYTAYHVVTTGGKIPVSVIFSGVNRILKRDSYGAAHYLVAFPARNSDTARNFNII